MRFWNIIEERFSHCGEAEIILTNQLSINYYWLLSFSLKKVIYFFYIFQIWLCIFNTAHKRR